MTVDYVSKVHADMAKTFEQLAGDPKLFLGEVFRHTTDSATEAHVEAPIERTVTIIKPTDLEQTVWQIYAEFFCQYHMGFEQFAKLYELQDIHDVKQVIENGEAPRRVEQYYRQGYNVLESISRWDFRIEDKANVPKLRRIVRICEDAMDLPINEDSDVRAALLLVPQEFKQMCEKQGLLQMHWQRREESGTLSRILHRYIFSMARQIGLANHIIFMINGFEEDKSD